MSKKLHHPNAPKRIHEVEDDHVEPYVSQGFVEVPEDEPAPKPAAKK